jgi:alkylhydroperoxidase family enzyme
MSRLPEKPGRRELGVPMALISKLAARAMKVPQVHLFTSLGQHGRLFSAWAPLGAYLLRFGRLPLQDTELVILRVGHLRQCEYELQQHRRIAARRGLGKDVQNLIYQGPSAEGLTDRQRALLTATDELLQSRTISDATWTTLSQHLDRRQLIEFVMLAAQYDALAAFLVTLKVPLDFPD